MNIKRLRNGCEVNPNEAPWVVYIRNCNSNVPTNDPDCTPDCKPDCTPDCTSKYTQTDCTPECTPDCTPDCISKYSSETPERQVNLINENLVCSYF